jgi:hypothetical protein
MSLRNVMWEGHRMMVGGYRDAIIKMRTADEKVERPILDEDYIAELERRISLSLKTGDFIKVSYYFSGYIRSLEGKALRIKYNRLELYTECGVKAVYLGDLVGIE